MKIAVIHEWLVERAGSEKVLEQILACYPNADLFCLVDSLDSELRAGLLGKKATTSFIAKLPFARKKPWIYLPLLPIAIEQFDLSTYDLVLSSSHAVAKGVITGPNQVHVSYVHSPMRYAWDLQHEYLKGSLGRGLRGIALRSALHYLRLWDVRTAHGVDAFVANSGFVKKRIWKVYRRDAHVVHPPIDLDHFTVRSTKDDFYLCASRLVSYKRIDLVVQAFAQSGRKLVVIGDGPELRAIRDLAGPNVTLLGFQPDAVLRDHLQRAKALIFAGEEDFGLLPVEAQACGTPVIAYARGGALETVLGEHDDRPTGVFFDRQTPEALLAAVDRFEATQQRFTSANCRTNAERFSQGEFRSRFTSIVTQALSNAS